MKKEYQIILYSDNFDAVTPNTKNDKRIEGLIDKMYFSNEIYLNKRKKKTFRYILKDIGRLPSECIFVDDKKESFIYPNKIGMNTILFKNYKQLKKI